MLDFALFQVKAASFMGKITGYFFCWEGQWGYGRFHLLFCSLRVNVVSKCQNHFCGQVNPKVENLPRRLSLSFQSKAKKES
jgi:hypothetical protein